MEIIQEFLGSFNELTKQDWSEILILLGVASLLSFIIGWILRSFKVSSLKRLLADKNTEYNQLNTNYREKVSLLSAKEEDEMVFNSKIKNLNDELQSLRLKLSEKNTSLSIKEEVVEEIIEEGEDGEIEVAGKKRWLDKIRDVFSTNQPIDGVQLEDADSISLEEKLAATNSLVERLLTSNEQLEDDNLQLKNKVVELENKPVEVKTVVQEAEQKPVVIDKSEVEKYTKSLSQARITGQDLLKRIQELEIYNGKVIKQLEEVNNLKSNAEIKLKHNGDFKTKYTDIAARFEQAEIKNNQLSAQVQKFTSTAKQNTFEVELKNKTALLDDCTKEKTTLQNKLKELSQQIERKNELADKQLKEAAQKEKAALEQKEAEAKKATELKARQQAEALKTKQAEEAKATAELKAKQEVAALQNKEAEAKKAAAELKAKQEAELKKAAELKAKQAADIQKQSNTNTPLDSSRDIMERIKSKAASINFGRIGKGDSTKKDDLKEIKGIGEFVEKKLNALGIYNFQQVANLVDDDIDKVNDAIEFFPGRIKRDNWVGQAKNLSNKK